MAGALSLFDKLVASGTKVDYDALDAECKWFLIGPCAVC